MLRTRIKGTRQDSRQTLQTDVLIFWDFRIAIETFPCCRLKICMFGMNSTVRRTTMYMIFHLATWDTLVALCQSVLVFSVNFHPSHNRKN